MPSVDSNQLLHAAKKNNMESQLTVGVDGVAVGRDLECEEAECEGDEQEEVEKCGGEGEAGGIGDGVAN